MINLRFTEAKEDCDNLNNRITDYSGSIKDAIGEFGGLRDQYTRARNLDASLSFGQSAIGGSYGVLGLTRGLLRNSSRHSVRSVPTKPGMLPVGVFSKGGVVGANNPAFRDVFINAERQRNIGAGIVAFTEGGSAVATESAGKFGRAMQRFFDPAGRIANVRIDRADAGSAHLQETLGVMRDYYQAMKDKYDENCR